MLTYIHHSNTVIIVLHEIYGTNKHIVDVCEKISKCEMDVMAPDLLKGRESFRYDQEAIAYQYFMNNIGFERAFTQVKEVLQEVRSKYQNIYVLGYSVGATLAWLCSETGLCDLVIGFYGSRIRDYLKIEPQCPALLFFPAEERSFDVEGLISHLNGFDAIRIEKLSGKHGFADPFSRNYHKKSAMKAWLETMSFVKKHKM